MTQNLGGGGSKAKTWNKRYDYSGNVWCKSRVKVEIYKRSKKHKVKHTIKDKIAAVMQNPRAF